jgi:hypothetical protein
MNEMRPWRGGASKHLCDLTVEELEATLCQDCKVNNLAEYACRTFLKNNEAVCCECCECGECG